MSQISPPIRILLVCAVAFMVAWMLFLRPSTDAGDSGVDEGVPTASQPADAGGVPAESAAGKAVEAANDAAASTEARAEQLSGQEGETATATNAAPTDVPAAGDAEAGETGAKVSAEGGLPLRVLQGLADRKVVVLLFWTPRAADDKQVRRALSDIDRHDGKVLAHATHIKRIAAYGQITRGADVEQSPTVVVIDRNRKVETLVGYVDRVTIDQAVTDALRNS